MPNYRVSPAGTSVRAPDGQIVFLYGGLPLPEYVVDPVLQSLIDNGDVFDDTSEPHEQTGGSRVASALADQQSSSLAVALADGVEYVLVAADIDSGDSELVPASGNPLAMGVGGEISLSRGTYHVKLSASATYEVAPDAEAMFIASANFTGDADARLFVLRSLFDPSNPTDAPGDVALQPLFTYVNGDDASTELNAAVQWYLIVTKDVTVTVSAMSQGAAGTLTAFQIRIVGPA